MLSATPSNCLFHCFSVFISSSYFKVSFIHFPEANTRLNVSKAGPPALLGGEKGGVWAVEET